MISRLRFPCGLLCLLQIVGCHVGAPSPVPPPNPPKVFLRALENPATLDPAHAVRALECHLACLIQGGLVRCDEEGKIIPELADSWRVLEDGRKLRFTLREGLKFSSGRDLTSADVLYSWNRVCSRAVASPHAWVFEEVLGYRAVREGTAETLAGLRAPSEREIEVETQEPSASLLARLSIPAARIVDRDEVAAQGDSYGRRPLALGAWELAEWIDDSRVTLRPNQLYPGHNPNLSALEFRIVAQDFSAAALFETGGLHILQPLPPSQSARWRGFPEWSGHILRYPEMNLYYIGIGCHRPPLDRVEVRRAIARAVRPDRFRRALYGEVAVLAGGPIPPALLAAPPSESSNGANLAPQSEGNPEIRLEAPLQTLRPLELWYVESDSTTSLAMEAVQADLKAAGIECRLRKTDPTTYGSWRREGRFDLFHANWWADYPDADNFLSPLFLSGSSSNHTRFADAETDRLILAARREWDPERRTALQRQATDRIRSLAPVVFLWHRGSEALTQPWVAGYRPPALFHGTLFLDLRVNGSPNEKPERECQVGIE